MAINPNLATYSPQTVTGLTRRLDSARSQVGKAEGDLQNVLIRVAGQMRQNAVHETDPNRQRYWANAADNAEAQAQLHQVQAGLANAKTTEEIQHWQQQDAVAQQRAATTAQAVQNTAALDTSRIGLNDARVKQLAALTPVLIQQHQANTAYLVQRAQESTQRQALLAAQTTKNTET